MKELKLLSLVLVAGTATMFTACTSESDNSPSANISYESVAAAQQVPVTFGTYLGETPITRAGEPLAMTTDELKKATKGFGIFAYYTDHADYSASAKPNFMWNQKVTWNTTYTEWAYTPLKYWPNETQSSSASPVDGAAGASGGATTTGGIDKLSFFAYAPYAETVTTSTETYTIDPATGTFKDASSNLYTADGECVGITGFTHNNQVGDPKVSYRVASNPNQTVDLLWGVIPTGTTYQTVTTNQDETANAGKPNLNLTKQKTGETVDFAFKHALAKVNFTVQGVFDEEPSASLTNNVDAATKIVVESVSITNATFDLDAKLNLNNTTADEPLWSDQSGTLATLTVPYADINSDIRYNTADGTLGGQSTPTGVNKTKKPLLGNDANGNPLFFGLIPGTGKAFDVEITYHVFTADANLYGGYSKVTNVIKKTVSSLSLAGNTQYNFNLRLGMTSLKVSAEVAPWDTVDDSKFVDLPINVN